MTGAPPRGILAWISRLPLLLFRLRLGWLLGNRFVAITQRGRKTGKIRRSVVEVVELDGSTRRMVVVAAWGERTAWYRNLAAHPALEVRTGRVRYVPEQRLLGWEELREVLRRYRRQHPLASRELAGIVGIEFGRLDDEPPPPRLASLRGVEFLPRQPH